MAPDKTPAADRQTSRIVSASSRIRDCRANNRFRGSRAAQRRGDSGWVDLHFTVSIDGSVKDAIVSKSKPEGTFDEAALRAVEKWAFEPVVENGEAVEKRAGVRMMFAAE